jgi:glycosidase
VNSEYGSEAELKSLLRDMKKNGLKPMADIVINHRVGSTRGVGDLYNRYDGMTMPWDEYAVTSDSGGLVQLLPNFMIKWGFHLCTNASSSYLKSHTARET